MGIPANKVIRTNPVTIDRFEQLLAKKYGANLASKILSKVFDVPTLGSKQDLKNAMRYCSKQGQVLFAEQESLLTYQEILTKVNSRIIDRTVEQQQKLCFQLYDYNDDGFICFSDLYRLSQHFAGLNYFIMEDVMMLTKKLNQKNLEYFTSKKETIRNESIDYIHQKMRNPDSSQM